MLKSLHRYYRSIGLTQALCVAHLERRPLSLLHNTSELMELRRLAVAFVALFVLRKWWKIEDKDGALFGSLPTAWCHWCRESYVLKQIVCKLGYLGGFWCLLFRRPSRLVLHLWSARRVLSGVRYGDSNDTTMDVYAPPAAPVTGLPVCVFVHGGVWTFGSRFLYRLVGGGDWRRKV